MNREHLEKLNGNPAWKAAFDNALGQAEALHGEGSADALHYATTAADLAADPAAIANAEAADKAKAEAAYIEQLVADARSRPMPAADAAPDPADRARAGWAKAFGKDASPASEQSDLASSAPDANSEKPAEPAAASSGWSKAFRKDGSE
jgi:hypothetical protein